MIRTLPSTLLAADEASRTRRAFAHYLRTGRRLPDAAFADADEPIQTKFNPNHDPAEGRFTSAGGGGAAGGRTATGQRPPAARSPRKTPPMSDEQVEAHAAHALDQYHQELARGMTPDEAAAWAANSEAESHGDPHRAQMGGGPGRGLFQWGHPKVAMDRRIDFRTFAGIPIEQSTAQQQRDFRDWELRHKLHGARRKIDAAQGVVAKSRAVTIAYLAPFDKFYVADDRAKIAAAILRRVKTGR